ncbi:MAG: hypothetical protein Q7R41_05750, partial [Phycisphaerales bacterium]|nr:hypothetical protein [Phycisphaerales bacterium]
MAARLQPFHVDLWLSRHREANLSRFLADGLARRLRLRFLGSAGAMAMSEYQLPRQDDLGFCNILISALGGDGANMGGKLLFKIGCGEFGLDGGYDARYGSEKKGTPTDVSVRFCRPGTPVRQSGPTPTPHFLVVFHADLIEPLDL